MGPHVLRMRMLWCPALQRERVTEMKKNKDTDIFNGVMPILLIEISPRKDFEDK